MLAYYETYPGPPQISKMESLEKVVKRLQPFTIFPKLSVLDICGGPGYASEYDA